MDMNQITIWPSLTDDTRAIAALLTDLPHRQRHPPRWPGRSQGIFSDFGSRSG